jgi:rhodanese-related sulfurtransferase
MTIRRKWKPSQRPHFTPPALDFVRAKREFGARKSGSRREASLSDKADQVHDLTPEEVARGLTEGRYLLVDVREPNEVAAEAYPDAVAVPLSTFDPDLIPDPEGKTVVFACRSGKRSVTASLAAQAGGKPYNSHLAGGMLAWKAAGLPSKTGG